jgi:sporulation protein YlmC with PRC-barrel domain
MNESTNLTPVRSLTTASTAFSPVRPNEDVRGRRVAARDGQTIGKVDDLIVEPESGRVRLLVVSGGGILGIGKRAWPVPVDVVDDITPEMVFVDVDRTAMDAAPTMAHDVADRAHLADVYSFYGRVPFWVASYSPPDWTIPDRGVR